MMRWIDAIAGRLFGDDADTDAARPAIGLETLSAFLPWRMFDKIKGIYANANSHGFILEVAPFLGADDKVQDILTQFLSDGLQPGACVQVINWASPRVGAELSHWFGPRFVAGGVYSKLAKHRSDRLFGGVWDSLSKHAPFYLRHYRVIISVGLRTGSRNAVDDLVAIRESLKASLSSLEVPCREMPPEDLMRLVDEFTSPTTSAEEDSIRYNPLDSLSDQMVRRDIELQVDPDRLTLRTERFRPTGRVDRGVAEIGEIYPDHFDMRHFGVRNFPERWAIWDQGRLIGDLFKDALRFPCPIATVLCLEYPDDVAMSNYMGRKFLRSTSLADSKVARFAPQLREQSQEWATVRDEMQEGRKLVKGFYGVTMMAPSGKGDACERALKSIYRSAGWDLIDERFLQIHGLLTIMPLTLADGLSDDLNRLKRYRTMLTSTAAALMPIQGEYVGGMIPHLLLIGRRGQPFFWSPFENNAGNHNVSVVGASGSGKSVLIQELVTSLRGAGAQVFVIDDGRSFEHSAKLQGGDWIEVSLRGGFCLNPFSLIDEHRAESDEDYKVECLDLLRKMIGQMAKYIGTLSDVERGLIDASVNSVWSERKSSAGIADVAVHLKSQGREGNSLAQSLLPYCAGGTYEAFFNGPASLDLKNAYTVFEMAELAQKKELRAVVLSAIMFMISQMITRTPRQIKKALVIDEAWQLLDGGSMAEFIEAFARTCRKYGGSLITATQSINDYYKSSGSKAALENSDWMIVLRQKSESIADFKRMGRLDMNERMESLIMSLKVSDREYSEMFIKGPDTQMIGRLVLDEYSGTLFSSSAKTYAAIQECLAQGVPLEEAVEMVAFGKNATGAASSTPLNNDQAQQVLMAAE
jgi:conjugal transfer ATP-binding protein TraC